jgi:hypothetical protein
VDTSLTQSGEAADAMIVGNRLNALPQILEGTVEPASATGTLKAALDSAPNGSLYIQHN